MYACMYGVIRSGKERQGRAGQGKAKVGEQKSVCMCGVCVCQSRPGSNVDKAVSGQDRGLTGKEEKREQLRGSL